MPKVTIPKSQAPRKLATRAPRGSSGKPSISTRYPKSPPEGIPYDGNLLSIDPGYSTGVAARIDGKLMTSVVYENDVLQLIDNMNFVIVEDFSTSGRISAPGLRTKELCGMIQGYCIAKGIEYAVVTPQAKWTFAQHVYDTYLGPNKLIEKSKTQEHECDALAHLLSWEWRKTKK
jgi:hypothetical protein